MFACAKSDESKTSETETSNSDSSNSDTSAPSTAVRTSLVSSGSNECLFGGIKVETGIDENKNGILDDNEVDKTQYVCNGGTVADNRSYHKLQGFVQKGPYIQGTEITVREMYPYTLDDNSTTLIFTGKNYTGIIEDDSGTFSIKGLLDYNIVELSAMGYYFNEITGALSNSNLNLQAISDLNDNSSINVNLMTHLEKKRVEYLMDNGTSLKDAKKKVQGEIVKIFNIDNVTLGNSESLDISKAGTGNAVLLAISTVLQSNKTEAQLTELLSKFNTDIRTDGTLDSTTLKQTLVDATDYLKPRVVTIRNNIEKRYSDLGISAVIPAFEDYAFKLDIIDPTVTSTSPADNATSISLNSSVSVTLSDVVDNYTVTTNTTNNECTGTLQVSSDSFVTCVKMKSQPTSSNSHQTFTVISTDNLSYTRTYKIKVNNGVKDLAGNSLTEYTSVNGFTTLDGTVTYNGNGNRSGSVPLDLNKYSKGSTVIVKGNTGNMEWKDSDNKTEKLFNGWNTQASGSGTSYTDNSTFTLGSSPVTLYAQWRDLPSITISSQSDIDSNQNETYVKSITFSDNISIASISFPNLEKVRDNVYITSKNSNFKTLSLPKLTTLEFGYVYITDTALTSIDLSKLKSLGEYFYFTKNNSLTQLDLSSLETAKYVNFTNNSALKTLNLSSLTETFGDLSDGGNGGHVSINNNSSLDNLNLSSLQKTAEHLSIEHTKVTSLDLSSLKSTGGNLYFNNNTSDSWNLSSLESIGGIVYATNNAIKVIDMSSLKTVGALKDSGYFYMTGDTVLTELKLTSALTSIKEYIYLTGNTSLCVPSLNWNSIASSNTINTNGTCP